MNCPECQGADIIEIMYGTPSLDDTALISKIDSGVVILGGCVINEDSPAYYCKHCKHRFGNHFELRKQRKWHPFNKE